MMPIKGIHHAIEISKFPDGQYYVEHRDVDPNTNMGKGWIKAGATTNFQKAIDIARGVAKKHCHEGTRVTLGIHYCGKLHDGRFLYHNGKFYRRSR